MCDTYDHLLNLPGRYQYVRCRACDLVYLRPLPPWAERGAHYASTYRGYRGLETEPSAWQRLSMRLGLHKRLRIIKPYLAGGRVLDIGCGAGDFPYWANQQPGWSVYGLERAPGMARVASGRGGASVATGDALRLGFASASFDAVTLWSTLEHLPDPVQGLRECARVLRPNGLLVARTVDVDSWAARLFGSCWVGFDAPRVLVAFSKDTLRLALEQGGFQVLKTAYYFHDFYPVLRSLQNVCANPIRAPRLCDLVDTLARSWPSRLLSLPFFAVPTLFGKNSFVTVIARTPG